MGEVNCPLGLTWIFDTVPPHPLPRERAHHIPVSRSLTSQRLEGLRPPYRQELLRPPSDQGLLPGKSRNAFQQRDDLSSSGGHSTRRSSKQKLLAAAGLWLEQGRSLPSRAVLQQTWADLSPRGQAQEVRLPPVWARRFHHPDLTPWPHKKHLAPRRSLNPSLSGTYQ